MCFDYLSMSYRVLLKKVSLIIWVGFSSLYAQYSVTVYNSTSGYPHDLSYQIIQDAHGVIWIGSDIGLIRYNGTDFKTFTIADGFRNSYVIDVKLSDSNKIIATWGGGLHKISDQNVISVITPKDSLKKLQRVTSLYNGFITKFIGNNFSRYIKDGRNYDIKDFYVYQKNGQLYSHVVNSAHSPISGSLIQNAGDLELDYKKVDGRVFFFNETFSNKNRVDGVFELCDGLQLNEVFSFLNGNKIYDIGKYDNSTWYALTKNSLVLFSEKNGVIKHKDFVNSDGSLVKFYKKSNIEVYVQENHNGNQSIYVYDLKKKEWYKLPREYLKKSLVSDVLIDYNDNIWISTYGNGLIKVEKRSCLPIVKSFELKNGLDFIETPSGGYFLLEQYSINYINKELEFINRRKMPKSYVFTREYKDTIAIVGNRSDLKEFDFEGKRIKFEEKLRLYTNKRDSIFYLENNLVVKRGDITQKLLFNGQDPKYKNIDIEDVLVYDDKIWCASNMGVHVYELTTFELLKNISVKDGLSSNYVKKLAPSKNGIWIATINGVHRFENNQISTVDLDNGDQSHQINTIYNDRFDQLWIGTQKGLSLYKNASTYHFYEDGGMSSSFASKIFADQQGRIWVFGNNGVDVIENNWPFAPEPAPFFNVNQIKTNFEFEFVDYSKFSKVMEFQVNTQEWQSFNTRKLNFDNYKYGKYKIQFRVRKLNSDWDYSKKFYFSILRPWYIEWYMIVSYVIVVLVIVSVFVVMYLKRLKRRNKVLRGVIEHSKTLQAELDNVRENVAQDFHDELGNKLAGITVLSDRILDGHIDQKSKMYKDLFRINKDAKSLYYGIKDFIWSIDSKHDDLEELVLYLRDFGENLFANSDIQFFVNPNLDRSPVKLPYYWSRHLLLVFKEAMTNIFKHSKANRVDFTFTLLEDKLTIMILDNGIGFHKDELKRKNGLTNMMKRATTIGGRLTLFSDQGTKVLFEIEIPKKPIV